MRLLDFAGNAREEKLPAIALMPGGRVWAGKQHLPR
jgi:hypothetical protein